MADRTVTNEMVEAADLEYVRALAEFEGAYLPQAYRWREKEAMRRALEAAQEVARA